MKRRSLIIGLIVIFIDQFAKLSIDNSFFLGESLPLIKNFLYVTKVYNTGASWSMFSGMLNMLIVISLFAFVCFIYYQDMFKINMRNILAFGFIYGGLFGNLIDRIDRGAVIDFIHLKFGTYNFPIFNFADIALVIGFILLVISLWKGDDKHGVKSHRRHRRTSR